VSRPFRLTPPDARGNLILRPRVHQQLTERFDRRVTVVSAGPGFGKTTALTQMMAEHRLAPLGIDCWLGCEAGDHSPLNLASGIALALGSDPDTLSEGLVDSLVEAFAARAPAEVCLVLDDVHLVGDSALNSDGVSLLDDLVERLPANAHMVLAGRAVPPIRLSRLTAAGECLVIGEEQLRLTDEQVVDLARASGAAAQDFSRLAGWAALIALALGQGRPIDFVDEEILRGLDEHEKRLLLGLVAAGEADPAMLIAVTGVNDESSLERIPLVDRRGDRFVAHDLWTDILGDTPEVAEMRLHCVRHLMEEGQFEDAVELCLRSSTHNTAEWATLVDEALVAALGIVRTPSGATLREWSDRLPPDASQRAPGLLLRGLVVRLDKPSDHECRSLLERSAALFREAGELRGEAAALSALTYPLHVHRDSSGLSATYTRLVELADAGVGEAEHQRQLALGVLATATGQLDRVESHVRPLLDGTTGTAARGVALWLHFNALNGQGEVATEAADELARSGVRLPGFAVASLSAKWRAGELRSILSEPPPEPNGLRDRFLHAVWMTFVAATTGDTTKADYYLSRVRAGSGEASKLMGDGSDVIPEVAVAAERGEIERAASLLSDMIASHPVDGASQPYYVMSIGLIYPLIPEARGHFDGLQLGSLFHRDLRLNQVLVSLIEHDDSGSLQSIELPDQAEQMLPALGLRRTGELLAAAWAVDHPRAPELVADLVEMLGETSRSTFRDAAESTNELIASGARSIEASIPIQPAQSLELRLLGSTELYIDGEFVDNPEWRRHHVRSLLAFLVLNRRATREQIVAALWPDAGPDAGRRNLRSTLNRLNSVLEPSRGPRAAPFYIRSTGPRVQLVTADSFTLDIEDFGRHTDSAQHFEDAGTPSLAIDPYLAAVEIYRGDLLPESYDDWILVARDRLRARYVANAVRCSDLLVVSGRPHEATAVISSVVETEPWSEPAHRALVAAHLAAGDAAAARRAMATCEALLADIGGPVQEATLMLRRRLGQQTQ
jgi:LuxR family transcriptional regulator, maltose regulon positive regulatory protein